MPSLCTARYLNLMDYTDSLPKTEKDFIIKLFNLQPYERRYAILKFFTFGLWNKSQKNIRKQIRILCKKHPKWVSKYRKFMFD